MCYHVRHLDRVWRRIGVRVRPRYIYRRLRDVEADTCSGDSSLPIHSFDPFKTCHKYSTRKHPRSRAIDGGVSVRHYGYFRRTMIEIPSPDCAP